MVSALGSRWPPTLSQPWIVAAFVVLLISGCGGDTVSVTGRLLQDGKPYTANLQGSEPDTFAVDFIGTLSGTAYLFAATLKEDGTFSVGGSDGRGIPRGQYKITVLHSGFMGAGGDRLKSRYSADTTPLSVDITDSTSLTIDLGAGTVTK